MNVPTSVNFIAERLNKELFCMDGERPSISTNIRPHNDPKQGWIVEVEIKTPHNGMLPLLPTSRRLGGGSLSWDLERNAVIITGIVNEISVSVFITRVSDKLVRTSRN